MLSKRAQERISGTLSGWYTAEWNTGEIVWSNDILMVKDGHLADEIAYNLRQDLGREIVASLSSLPEFNDWTELAIR